MAIEHVTNNDPGARAKINAAIDKANQVDGKANISAVDALWQAIEGEAQARTSGLSSLQGQLGNKASTLAVEQGLDAQQNALDQQIRRGDEARITYVEHAADAGRPGEAPRLFTSEPEKAPETAAPISAESRAVAAGGAVIAIDGRGTVAPITVHRIEPGRQYRLRFVVQRATDTEDPANDGVRLAIQWLRADKSPLSVSVMANILDLTVADGRQEYSFVIAASDAANVEFVAPAGAVYWREFVRAYGSGVTHVEVMDRVDLTDAYTWSPDVSMFARQLASYSYRVDDVSVRFEGIEDAFSLSRNASWFTEGTIDDARLSDRVLFRDADEVVDGTWQFNSGPTILGPLYFGLATGGGPTARIIADGNYFAIAITDKAGGFNTLREFFFNPDASAPRWTAEGDFEATGRLLVGDAPGSRTNLGVYSKAESDAKDDEVRAYAEAQIAAQDAMVFLGVIDCSGNPNYPAADRGWTYRCSVAGRIGGANGKVVEAGDIIICLDDGSPAGTEAAVGEHWSAIQTNLVDALTSASIGVSVLGFDEDLAAIALLTTTEFGRGLLTLADAGALRSSVGVQARGYGEITTDAPATLTPGTTAQRIRHAGTLTADRTVTIVAAGATAGDIFHVTRTGSGAFNLSLGGLKNLAPNTWAEVTFDGAAWFLSAYGTL